MLRIEYIKIYTDPEGNIICNDIQIQLDTNESYFSFIKDALSMQ